VIPYKIYKINKEGHDKDHDDYIFICLKLRQEQERHIPIPGDESQHEPNTNQTRLDQSHKYLLLEGIIPKNSDMNRI
jgi:hypothetical protein